MNQRQAAVSRARREIMEAAGAQFAAHGYEGTSFSRVAEAMGKPKSAIGYHLFASKESLAGAVVEDQEDRWLRIEAALDRPGALHELIVFLLTGASTVEVCPVAAGAIRLLQDMPRLGLAVERRFDVWRFTREHLEAELAVRDIRAGDLDAVVDVLLSATFGVLSYRSPRLAEHDSAERLRSLWIPLLVGLGIDDADAVVRAARPLDLELVEVGRPDASEAHTGSARGAKAAAAAGEDEDEDRARA
ncbi:TetR/AcrR family transcriptional regulator [Clavibacter michiganensis subsp. michiganensis]|uniref:HTH-type transcriptional repressor AcnR n=1 Tax=Clavibacter michiganensis subsp. michiganensis TaxID=33013 RepID=A0A251XNW3_CLAMM|nr:helix-turn-helix domain-containing protein [Clavibacter michiganensis]MBW8025900.1 TetR/AcrR family transcriptional regulator [Clavibacter michiganensis subsp. michiganensis]MDO4067101.1 helix-turn-helix domain-containing protein [Clavibacter michiganensis]MDO4073186.1 helix-turn-helix domain-containing protein [Clavibacter michiganensis]MDO4091728.1 helix-turn-helix domain-containing protein [Clavibacter michiganensis]OUD88407.1 HTH-type transcriptional repressor AcnR [Clavibacter michigan